MSAPVRRWLLSIVCLSAFSAVPATATLVTYLEPRILDEMETVRFTIRAEGTAQGESPDFSPLSEDFDVLGNQTSSRISSINGRTVASVEYQLSLRPKRTGEIIVPSITIGNEQTEPIRLVVRPLDPALKESIERMVFFETELSTNPVYVQAETVLTRRLFYSQGVQIYSDLPGVPEIEHTVVIPLGETQSRSLLRNGQRYGVIEQRFAIFPERSGTITIPSISVTSSVRVQSGGRVRRSGVRVSTEAVELDVRPIPASYPAGAAWLPATDVSLSQRWEPARDRIDVGEPLTFELQARATGNRGSAIPPIPLPLPAEQFKIYPENPGMDESAREGTIVGQRSARYALIPTRPGSLNLPPLTLTWWDTRADQLRQAQVAIADLTVLGEAAVQAPAASAQPAQGTAEPSASRPEQAISVAWLVAAGVTAGLALIGASLFATLRRIPSVRLWLRVPGANADGSRRALRALRRATDQGDLADYRKALAAYLAVVYDLPAPAALAAFRREAHADAHLLDLDQAVYAGSPSGRSPDTRALTLLARQADRHRRRAATATALPALFS